MAKHILQTKDNKTKYCTAVATGRLWLQQQQQHNDTSEECSSTARASESKSARRKLQISLVQKYILIMQPSDRLGLCK